MVIDDRRATDRDILASQELMLQNESRCHLSVSFRNSVSPQPLIPLLMPPMMVGSWAWGSPFVRSQSFKSVSLSSPSPNSIGVSPHQQSTYYTAPHRRHPTRLLPIPQFLAGHLLDDPTHRTCMHFGKLQLGSSTREVDQFGGDGHLPRETFCTEALEIGESGELGELGSIGVSSPRSPRVYLTSTHCNGVAQSEGVGERDRRDHGFASA